MEPTHHTTLTHKRYHIFSCEITIFLGVKTLVQLSNENLRSTFLVFGLVFKIDIFRYYKPQLHLFHLFAVIMSYLIIDGLLYPERKRGISLKPRLRQSTSFPGLHQHFPQILSPEIILDI